MFDIEKCIELFKHHDKVKFILTGCGERECDTKNFELAIKVLEKKIQTKREFDYDNFNKELKMWHDDVEKDLEKAGFDLYLRVARDVLNSVEDMVYDNTIASEDVEED